MHSTYHTTDTTRLYHVRWEISKSLLPCFTVRSEPWHCAASNPLKLWVVIHSIHHLWIAEMSHSIKRDDHRRGVLAILGMRTPLSHSYYDSRILNERPSKLGKPEKCDIRIETRLLLKELIPRCEQNDKSWGWLCFLGALFFYSGNLISLHTIN